MNSNRFVLRLILRPMAIILSLALQTVVVVVVVFHRLLVDALCRAHALAVIPLAAPLALNPLFAVTRLLVHIDLSAIVAELLVGIGAGTCGTEPEIAIAGCFSPGPFRAVAAITTERVRTHAQVSPSRGVDQRKALLRFCCCCLAALMTG